MVSNERAAKILLAQRQNNKNKTTIRIKTNKSGAVEEWIMKEWGSFEDAGHDPGHVVAILQRFGKTITLTIAEADTVIQSARYNAEAWNDDEIDGGARTKQTIARWANKISDKLNTL